MDYLKGYKKYGRMLRYYNLIQTQGVDPTTLVPEAVAYTEELKNIGAFARLKDILSSQVVLDEPEWKKATALKLFDTVKEVEGRLAATYAEDDKAQLSLELAGLHEEHGEYLKAIRNLTGVLETLKNKTLLAEILYRLVRLSIFTDNFHQANTYLERLRSVDSFTGNAYARFIDFAAFLMALRTPDRFGDAFALLDKVLVFDEADQWRFSEFLSFGDVAIYGALLGLLTQKHQTNVARLVNNPLFRNHADTVPELVVLLEDYRNNRFNLICADVSRLEVCDAALTRSGTLRTTCTLGSRCRARSRRSGRSATRSTSTRTPSSTWRRRRGCLGSPSTRSRRRSRASSCGGRSRRRSTRRQAR